MTKRYTQHWWDQAAPLIKELSSDQIDEIEEIMGDGEDNGTILFRIQNREARESLGYPYNFGVQHIEAVRKMIERETERVNKVKSRDLIEASVFDEFLTRKVKEYGFKGRIRPAAEYLWGDSFVLRLSENIWGADVEVKVGFESFQGTQAFGVECLILVSGTGRTLEQSMVLETHLRKANEFVSFLKAFTSEKYVVESIDEFLNNQLGY